ncbi:MAG: HAMP domain-containing sensor histidine kinase [Bacillota bacterium]|nr:HAMP domain-containing sensor histidine kinase [Bacillota bacterium]
MFQKTKLRLVSLYTLVFFLILSSLGVSLYFYMYHTSLSSIDDKLSQKATFLFQNNGKEFREENERESERKVSYLFWGERGKFLMSYPINAFFKKDFAYLSPRKENEKLRTQEFDGHTYRIMTIHINGKQFEAINNETVKTLQLVYNIDPEINILKNLFKLIGFGSAGGLLISYFAGLFLANKALVPIQRSWEKQSQFVADASHELRTPLSVIQTHLELLFRHPTNTIEQESETIFNSLSEVKRVNKLVTDLLTLARSDSNDLLINPHLFLMDEMLEVIVEQFTPIANIKEINLFGKIESDIHYYGDKERIHQLFIILLDNSLKYTSSKGKVSIICEKEGNNVIITIEDNGIGISEEDLPYIFDRFFRSDKGRTRSEGGTGLGLSIANWIVKAHEGQIKIESKLKVGTKFIVKLPIRESFK